MTAKHPPKNPAEKRVWIKAQLELRKCSFAAIGRELDVTRQTVRKALDVSYPKMERAIAAKLGLSPDIIWPERYAG